MKRIYSLNIHHTCEGALEYKICMQEIELIVRQMHLLHLRLYTVRLLR